MVMVRWGTTVLLVLFSMLLVWFHVERDVLPGILFNTNSFAISAAC